MYLQAVTQVAIVTSYTLLWREEGTEEWSQVEQARLREDSDDSPTTWEILEERCLRVQYAVELSVGDTVYPEIEASYPGEDSAVMVPLDDTDVFTVPLHPEVCVSLSLYQEPGSHLVTWGIPVCPRTQPEEYSR